MQELPPYAVVGLVVLTGVALFLAGTQGTRLLRPTAPTPGKLTTYECGVDPVRLVPILHYDGTPITARYIARAIGDHLDALKVTPLRKAVS